jgi:hypothetical protein
MVAIWRPIVAILRRRQGNCVALGPEYPLEFPVISAKGV